MIDIMRRAFNNPEWAFERVCYHTLKQIGHYDYKRFIVLTRSRTGSSMLLSFLNSHPNIESHGEIVNRLHGKDYKEILRKTFQKSPIILRPWDLRYFILIHWMINTVVYGTIFSI